MIKITTKYGLVLACILSIIILSTASSGNLFKDYEIGLAEQTSSSLNSENKVLDNENVVIQSQVELEAVSYEYLSKESDIILIGTVNEMLPSKWNTLDGKRPFKSIEESKWYNMIYTDVVINVDECLKGSSDEEVTVRIFNGSVDGDTMIADYEASFQSGEKVFLYLIEDEWKYTKDLGPEHYFVLGSMQGKFTLTEDGKAVRKDNVTTLGDLKSTLEDVEQM